MKLQEILTDKRIIENCEHIADELLEGNSSVTLDKMTFIGALIMASAKGIEVGVSHIQLNASQVASLFNVSVQRVGQLARSRGVGRKEGREWRFHWQEIEEMFPREKGRPAKGQEIDKEKAMKRCPVCGESWSENTSLCVEAVRSNGHELYYSTEMYAYENGKYRLAHLADGSAEWDPRVPTEPEGTITSVSCWNCETEFFGIELKAPKPEEVAAAVASYVGGAIPFWILKDKDDNNSIDRERAEKVIAVLKKQGMDESAKVIEAKL